MIELLLNSGMDPLLPEYPNSGPGPKRLKKLKDDVGYFGLVTTSQLFTAAEVEAASPRPPKLGAVANTAVVDLWAKFLYKGKFIYMARLPIRTATSWNDIYLSGLIYGKAGPGQFPGANAPTDQLVYMSKNEGAKEHIFKVRVPSGFNVDPISFPVVVGEIADSEYSLTMERVFGQSGVDVIWDYLTAPGGTVMCMESISGQPTYSTVARSNNLVNSRTNAQKVSTTGRFWPVLELVPDPSSEVIPDTGPPGQMQWKVPGTYTWVCPEGINSVCVVAVAGGQSAVGTSAGEESGGLRYRNSIPVTPGTSYTIVVGSGKGSVTDAITKRDSTAFGITVGVATRGSTIGALVKGGWGSTRSSDGKHNNGGNAGTYVNGMTFTQRNQNAGTFIGGMGIDLLGQANSSVSNSAGVGGLCGGGGGYGAEGGNGGVRIIWGAGRSFPDNALNV